MSLRILGDVPWAENAFVSCFFLGTVTHATHFQQQPRHKYQQEKPTLCIRKTEKFTVIKREIREQLQTSPQSMTEGKKKNMAGGKVNRRINGQRLLFCLTWLMWSFMHYSEFSFPSTIL